MLFRLNVVEFHIPPIRERPDDILFLTEYFLKIYERDAGKENMVITNIGKDAEQ